MLRESALFLSEFVHRRHRRRECCPHSFLFFRFFSFFLFLFSVYACTYMYKYTYMRVCKSRVCACPCACTHMYIIFMYVRMYARNTYIYTLISDPNYRVNYRLILKNTHVYVHVQLQHTPGRQESWSSETLITSSFFFKRRLNVQYTHLHLSFQQQQFYCT